MDMIPERFPRGPGQVPRATVACYAVAVLTAVVAVAVGLFEGDGRSVAEGILAAILGATLWVAIGTSIALLAQVADRREALGSSPGPSRGPVRPPLSLSTASPPTCGPPRAACLPSNPTLPVRTRARR